MRNVLLVRKSSDESGTFGVLSFDGKEPYATLEPPWRNNERNVSCIPVGTYLCVNFLSAKFGKCWLVTSVPNRSDILLHIGNYRNDTEGCILVAEERIKDVIYKSRRAFTRLREEIPWPDPFILKIVDDGAILERNRAEEQSTKT